MSLNTSWDGFENAGEDLIPIEEYDGGLCITPRSIAEKLVDRFRKLLGPCPILALANENVPAFGSNKYVRFPVEIKWISRI